MDKNSTKNHINNILTKDMKESDNPRLPNVENASWNIYNVTWATVIAVDIVDFGDQINFYKRWAIINIMQAFTSTVIKIGKENDNFVSAYVAGDQVILCFSTYTKEKIQSIYSTAIEINSAINYLMKQTLEENKYNHDWQVGVGIWTSEDNSLVKYGEKSTTNEVFSTIVGESIIEATRLSDEANRGGYPEILMNDITFINLDKECDPVKNNWIHSVSGLGSGIYGCNVRYQSYAGGE